MPIISMKSQVKCTKLHYFLKTDGGNFVFVFRKNCVKFQSTFNIQVYLHVYLDLKTVAKMLIHVKHVWWNDISQRVLLLWISPYFQIKLVKHEAILCIILLWLISHLKRSSITVYMIYSRCRSVYQNRNKIHSSNPTPLFKIARSC